METILRQFGNTNGEVTLTEHDTSPRYQVAMTRSDETTVVLCRTDERAESEWVFENAVHDLR